MGVVKNLMVRVGADLSGLVSGFNKASKAPESFKKRTEKAMQDSVLSVGNLKKAMAQGGKNSGIVSLVDQIRELEAEQKAFKDAGFSWGYEGFEQNERLLKSLKSELKEYTDGLELSGKKAEESLEDASTAARKLGTNSKSAFSGVKKVVSWISNLGKGAKSSSDGVDKLIRTVKRFGLVAVGIRLTKALFGELRGIVSRYVSENASLQAQVDSLKSSLGQALAPAINLVTNALSYLMPYVVGVSNAIGSLITNLFGTGWTTVADGANAAAAATGGATAAQEKYNRTLAGFDEITKLNSSNSSGSGGSSSSTTTTQTAGKLPAWMTDLTAQIKEAINQGDYTSVGAHIGEKIALGLTTAEQYLKSVSLGGVGKAIAQGINGAIDSLNNSDSSLGSVLASAIQVGIDGASGFVKNLNWSGLGTGVKKSLKDLFTGIDWKSVLSTMGATAGGIGTAIWAAIGDGITAAKDYFWQHIEDAGYDTVQGVLNGVVEGILNIGTWIKDNVFTPFVEGFKSTFQIHSPSKHKDITSLGENIIGGILNGIAEAIRNPAAWIQKNVFQPLKEGFSQVFGKNGYTLDFSAKLSSWKDGLTNKALNFQAKLTTWKDTLKSKYLEFKANVKQGWTGTLAKKLGIDSITSKLNMKLPKISIDWGTTTVFSKTFKYPKGFNIKWNAKGLIMNGATIFGSAGSTLLGGGEAGREALLPLDRNTGWMDKIADRVALRVTATQSGPQEITINLVLDGKVISKTVVNHVNAQARATGTHPFAAYI